MPARRPPAGGGRCGCNGVAAAGSSRDVGRHQTRCRGRLGCGPSPVIAAWPDEWALTHAGGLAGVSVVRARPRAAEARFSRSSFARRRRGFGVGGGIGERPAVRARGSLGQYFGSGEGGAKRASEPGRHQVKRWPLVGGAAVAAQCGRPTLRREAGRGAVGVGAGCASDRAGRTRVVMAGRVPAGLLGRRRSRGPRGSGRVGLATPPAGGPPCPCRTGRSRRRGVVLRWRVLRR